MPRKKRCGCKTPNRKTKTVTVRRHKRAKPRKCSKR